MTRRRGSVFSSTLFALVVGWGVVFALLAYAAPEPGDVGALVRAGQLADARSQAEAQSGERTRLVGPSGLGRVKAIVWGPSDGKVLIATYDGPVEGDARGVSVIDTDRWREVMRLSENSSSSVDGLAVSPDGTIGLGSFNGVPHLWNRTGLSRAGLDCGRGGGEGGHSTPSGASGIAFSADGNRVAVGCADGTLRVWSITGDRFTPARTSRVAAAFSAIAFSPDNKTIAWATWDGWVAVTDWQNGKTQRFGRHARSQVGSVVFDSTGKTLATSSRDGQIRVWDVLAGKARRTFKVAGGLAVPASLSPDGRLVATGGPDGLQTWDAESGKLVERYDHTGKLPAPSVNAVAFRPDGKQLAEGSATGIAVWDLETRARAAEIAALGDTGVTSVVFSPTPDLLAVAGSGGPRVWDLDEKIPSLKTLRVDGPAGDGEDLVFAADGRSLVRKEAPSGFALHATTSQGTRTAVVESGKITVLDGTGKSVLSIDGAVEDARVIAIGADGASLVTATGSGRISLWDVATGKKTAAWMADRAPIVSLAVSAAGRWVAIGTTRGGVEIWDSASRRRTRTLDLSPGYPQAIAFSLNDARMAVGMSRGGTVVLSLPGYEPTLRLTSVAKRDAAFVEMLPSGPIRGWGRDAEAFMSCRAGRFLLPPSACEGIAHSNR